MSRRHPDLAKHLYGRREIAELKRVAIARQGCITSCLGPALIPVTVLLALIDEYLVTTVLDDPHWWVQLGRAKRRRHRDKEKKSVLRVRVTNRTGSSIDYIESHHDWSRLKRKKDKLVSMKGIVFGTAAVVAVSEEPTPSLVLHPSRRWMLLELTPNYFTILPWTSVTMTMWRLLQLANGKTSRTLVPVFDTHCSTEYTRRPESYVACIKDFFALFAPILRQRASALDVIRERTTHHWCFRSVDEANLAIDQLPEDAKDVKLIALQEGCTTHGQRGTTMAHFQLAAYSYVSLVETRLIKWNMIITFSRDPTSDRDSSSSGERKIMESEYVADNMITQAIVRELALPDDELQKHQGLISQLDYRVMLAYALVLLYD